MRQPGAQWAQKSVDYAQRRTHRLPEWRQFCAWIETLPYAKEFILSRGGEA